MVYYLFIEDKDIHLGVLSEALKDPNINFSSRKFGILQDYIKITTQMYNDIGIYDIVENKLNKLHIYKFKILKELSKNKVL